MCGIVGGVGVTASFDKFFCGLRALEYRGYDSFGFCVSRGDELERKRVVGPISQTPREEFDLFNDATNVISHTRWATHGSVSEQNAHPHVSQDGAVAIVHNGVVTNFSELRGQIPDTSKLGQTDTEVASNIIAHCYAANGGDKITALQDALAQFEGEFAICGLFRGSDNEIFAAKRKSPLIVAKVGDGIVLCSDKAALVEFGNSLELSYLDDNTLFYYADGQYTSYGYEDGKWTNRSLNFRHEEISGERYDKGDFPHYMIKEIHESVDAIRTVTNNVKLDDPTLLEALSTSSLSLVGSGSAYYVTMIAQYLFKGLANTYAATHPSDEYLGVRPLTASDMLLTISQSGETFDTLEVVRAALGADSKVLAVNNVRSCTMQRIANFPIFQNSGKEVCVLSTKSIVSQVIIFYLMALELGVQNGHIGADEEAKLNRDLRHLPLLVEKLLARADEVRKLATTYCHNEHWFFIGRGLHYPVALESALKFKEVSYLHAEGMPAGFFKHGTISLIDEDFLTVAFLPSATTDKELFQLTIDNLHEIKARGGRIIGIGHEMPAFVEDDLFTEYLSLAGTNRYLNAITQLIAGQLFAYYAAAELGRSIDKPRGLAKSVTVR